MKSVARKTARGFTLIEIMVVVVILGILGALVAPQILGRAGEAKVTAAKSDIQSIGNALDLYKLDNNNYPSTDQGLEALVVSHLAIQKPRIGTLTAIEKAPR